MVMAPQLHLPCGAVLRPHRREIAPPAEREASGSPLEADEDDYFGHLNPKSETRSTKQMNIRISDLFRPIL